jgi:uncharacterized protein (TIGR02246 family)
MNRVLTMLVLIGAIAPLRAQPAEDPAHQALRGLKNTMEKALNARDLDTIVANVDANVVFTTMNGDVCRGPEQIRAYFQKMLNAPGHIVKDVKVSFEVDALTTLYGGDTGVAYGSSHDHYELTDGSTFDINARWTATMVRNGDRWVIAAFHYSADVFDNPITARLKKLIWQLALATGLVGLLFGYFGGWLFHRRKA